MKLKKIISLLVAGCMTLTFIAPNLPQTAYAEEETIGYSAEWVVSNGTYTITNNHDEAITCETYPKMYFNLSGITDWNSSKYSITADFQCTTETSGAFVCEHGEGCTHGDLRWWDQGADLTVGTEKNTLCFVTNYEKLSWLSFIPWELPANSTLTISNIKVEVIPDWTETNGVWTFVNSTSRKLESGKDYSSVPINTSSVTDWSKIQYITAEVWTESDYESTYKTGYPDDVYGAFEYGTPDTYYASSATFCATSTVYDTKRSKTVAVLPTYGKSISWLSFTPWNINSKVTFHLENVQFHTDEYDERLYTEQKWVKLDDGTWYYGHLYAWEGGLADDDNSKNLPIDLPAGIKWSDVQSISMDIRTASYVSNVTLIGKKADGSTYKSAIAVSSPNKALTVTRNLRGQVVSDCFLKPGWLGRGTALYISNIRLSTEPIPTVTVEPNDILIDDTQTIMGDWNAQTIIDMENFESITTTGVLKFYTTKDPSVDEDYKPIYMFGFNDSALWGTDEDSWHGTATELIPENGIIELRVDEEMMAKLRRSTLHVMGGGFTYTKAIFTPDSDAPVPETETVVPDTAEKEQLDKEFDKHKHHIKHEHEGPKKNSDMEHNKLYVQRGVEKDHNGQKVYALRFVQKMKKSDLHNTKNIELILHAKGKYVKFTTTSYFDKVNINGEEIKANDDEVFIIFILDDIPVGESVSFSEMRFN